MLITVRACFSGIGQGRVTSNLDGAPVDDAVFVTDKEAVEMVREQFIDYDFFCRRKKKGYLKPWMLLSGHFFSKF